MNEIRTWRERIGVGANFPLHVPTDVERAMEAEIAELRDHIAQPATLLGEEELAGLRRFDECARDGEGYDVPAEMMARLAEIGVVRRLAGRYFSVTEFGARVLEIG